MLTSVKTRDQSVDILKGFLIIFVLLGHLPVYMFNVPITYFNNFVEWIYLFHMPMFFAISLLFFKTNTKWVINRLLLLFIPYILWHFYYNTSSLPHDSLLVLKNMFYGNWSHVHSILWFLPALISLTILYYIFRLGNIFIKTFLLFISVLVTIFSNNIAEVHPAIPFEIDVAFYILPMALAFKILYQHKSLFCKINNTLIISTIVITSFVLLKFSDIVKFHIVDLAQYTVPSLIMFPLFFVLSMAIFIFFLKTQNMNKLILFSFVGKFTLPIFLLHPIIQGELYEYVVKNSPLTMYTDIIGANAINYIYLFFIFIISLLFPILISISFSFFSKKFKYLGFEGIGNNSIINFIEEKQQDEKKISITDNFFKITINWALILAFTIFWSFAVTGSVFVSDSQSGDIKILFGIFTAFLIFSILGLKKVDDFKDSIEFYKSDLLVLVPVLFLLFALSYNELFNPIIVDEIYHAQYSVQMAMSLSEYFAKKYQFIQDASYLQVIHAINFLILLVFAVMVIVIKRLNFRIQLITFSAIFLTVGFMVLSTYGHNYDPHPPLRLLPLFLSSTLFYPTDFSFRLPQFLGYVWFVFLSYRFGKEFFEKYVAIIFSSLIATIPIFWNVGVLVEQSVWSAIFFGYISMLIIQKAMNTEYEINYVRLFALLSIFILLRQSSIVGFVPIILMFIVDRYRQKDFSVINVKIFYIFLPLIVFIPFLLKSLIFGTPATPVGGNGGIFSNFILALESGVVYNSMINNLLYYVLFLFFALYTFKKSFVYGSILLIFFACNLLVFYNTNTVIWGNNRYQAEIFMPLLFTGLFWVVYTVRANKLLMRLLIVIVLLNILVIKNLNLVNLPVDQRKLTYFDDVKKLAGSIVLSEFTMPIDKALKNIPKNDRESLYIHGHTYGIFHQILHGDYTIGEAMQNRKLVNSLNIGWGDSGSDAASKINNNLDINTVLFTTLAHQDLLDNLEKLGWLKLKNVYDQHYSATIFVLKRPEYSIKDVLSDDLHNQSIEKKSNLKHFNIDNINNDTIQNARFVVQKNNISINGWIFSDNYTLFNQVIFVLFNKQNNKKYYIENVYCKERQDVATSFGYKEVAYGGFTAKANIVNLPNGIYDIYTLAEDKYSSWAEYQSNYQVEIK